MIEMTEEVLDFTFRMSILLSFGWLFFQFAAYAALRAWFWITDGDTTFVCNPVNRLMAKSLGWEINSSLSIDPSWRYQRMQRGHWRCSDGTRWVGYPALILGLLPPALLIIQAAWVFSLLVLGTYLGMHLARFVMRLSKTMKKHMEDKNVHN